MSRHQPILSRMPDADDVPRRLADVIRAPRTCPRRARRNEGRGQGGSGPPCWFESRMRFADTVPEEMHGRRAFRIERRDIVENALRH